MNNEPITIPDNPHARRLYDFIVASAWPEGRTIDGAECPAGLCQIVTKRLSQAIGISRPSIDHWLGKLETAGVIARPDDSVMKVLSMHFKPKNAKWVILLPRVVYFKPTPKKSAGECIGASFFTDETSRTLAVARTLTRSCLSMLYTLMKLMGDKPSAASRACAFPPLVQYFLCLYNLLNDSSKYITSELLGLNLAEDLAFADAHSTEGGLNSTDEDHDLYVALGIEEEPALSSVPSTDKVTVQDEAKTVPEANTLLSASDCKVISELLRSAPLSTVPTSSDVALQALVTWAKGTNQTREANPSGGNGHTRPTLQDVLQAASEMGIPEQNATRFFHHYASTGWTTQKGKQLVNWRSRLQYWAEDDRKRDEAIRESKRQKRKRDLADKTMAAVASGELNLHDGMDRIYAGLEKIDRPPF